LPLAVDPTSLMDLSTSRRLHEAVSVALGLGVFKGLRNAKTSDELAGELILDSEATYYLLKLLVQTGCLTETEGKFCTTSLADVYLCDDSYLYLGHEFETGGTFSQQLLRALLPASVHDTPEPDWNRERLRQIGVFGLMGSIQSTVAGCDLSETRRLLDLGGGHGFYSIAFAQKYPGLKITLFDLPHIANLAESFVQQFALQEQIVLRGGNFLTDDIGCGYDAVLCANVLHSNKRDIVLGKVRQALNPGGQIIVKTRIGDAPENLVNADTKLLWQARGGRELFSFAEWQGFLESHGFRNAKQTGLSGIYATIVALAGE